MVLAVKNLPANARGLRDIDSIPGSGRSPGGGHGNPLQHSCLENPTDRGAWRATVHGVAQSQTRLKRLAHTRAAAASDLQHSLIGIQGGEGRTLLQGNW